MRRLRNYCLCAVAFVAAVLSAFPLIAIVAILLGGCGPLPPGESYADFSDRQRENALGVYLGLVEFENEIGPIERDFGIVIGPTATESLGRCQRGAGWQEISINDAKAANFAVRIAAPYPEVFRAVFLHELVHTQLSCSDSDHSDDPENMMYKNVNRRNLGAPLPVELFE